MSDPMSPADEYRIELSNCECTLLDEIANPVMKRNDVASTYGLAIRSGEDVDWGVVNMAITDRWSLSALVYIKKRAWAHLEGQQ